MAPLDKLEGMYEQVADIFDQAQASLANHKKNCVALFKVHTKAAAVTQPAKNGKGVKLVGEKVFQDFFMDMLSRVLVIKKGPVNADRIVKYVGAFVKFMNEKVLEAKAKNAAEGIEEDEDEEETSTSRFVARLLGWLLQGFTAKNKNVRYRCIHVVSEMISHLGEIDEDTYKQLCEAVMDRLNDKETLIRAHAVIALAKLIGTEDPDEVEQGEQTITQILLDVVSTDPAAEVRRAALLNVPLSPTTLTIVLSRTRDVDPVTRKLVYTGVLQHKLGHPRHLTIAQREQVIKDGLGDREPAVRVAAGKLVAAWFDAVAANEDGQEEQGAWQGDDGGVMKGLVKFLGLFDVFGPGEAIAVDAVLSILTTRPDVPDVFVFPEGYWKELTPESALLARVFVEHCISTKNDARLESAALPVVTAFAFHIQEAYNNMLEVLQEIETAKILRAGLETGEVDDELEEELAKREVIMSELLRIMLKLDYGDEIGRRKVFSVVKDMLAHPELPPGLIERCLDVLKEIMPSERDLIRVIVEIVVELREPDDGEENEDDPPIDDDKSDASQATARRDKADKKGKGREEMSPEERARADSTDVRCLLLIIATLERVNGTFEDNSTLEGILGDLIIPSVKRKELAMREKALVSLGLCCLIAKNMALSSFQLFLSQAQNAPIELKVQVLRIIMDMLIMYDQEFFARSPENTEKILDFLLQILEAEESPEAQAVIVTGFCKLLLAGMITESRVLTCLALMYISPTTADNQEVRQCLSYFFPVYSYSSPANQDRMQAIFMPTFDLAVRMYDDLEDDQEMIAPYQFGQLMVDWTNPKKAAEIALKDAQNLSHVHLATEILVALYDSDRTPDQQKALCQLLGQLDLEHGLDDKSILKLNILLSHHEEQCPFENSAVEKIFDKYKNHFTSLFETKLEEINPSEHMDDDLRDMYQRIGMDAPEDGEDGGGRRRRSRAKGKRGVQDEEEEEEEAEEDDEEQEEEEEEQEDEQEEVEAEDKGETAEEEGTPIPIPEVNDQHHEEEDKVDDKLASEPEEEAPEPSKPDVPEEESEGGSPPPSRPKRGSQKRATRQPARKSKAAPKASKVRQESEEQVSDEENIPPPVAPKKKGTKRTAAASEISDAPVTRKRTRVKAPLKPAPKEASPEASEAEEEAPEPPKPAGRTTRGRAAKAQPKAPPKPKGHKKAAAPLPPPPDSDNEADEVLSALSSLRSTPEARAADSDDFGGYSD